MTASVLDGVRIVELARNLAGPTACLMLAECGADVIKVEPPGGDPARGNAGFATWNRSKRSVVLDIDVPADRAQLDALLSKADVLLHDLRPSEARKSALDDAALAARFPQLIVSSVLGYPVGHRDAERPFSELLVQARMGLMDEHRGYREGPIALRKPMASYAAANLAAAGIVTRLYMREDTGRGGTVHTSLQQGMLAVLSLIWHRSDNPKAQAFLINQSRGSGFSLRNSMYQCADGHWLQIMNPGDRIDLSVLPLTKKVSRERDIARPWPWDRETIERCIGARPRGEWLEALRAADTAVEPVTPLGEVLRLPDSEANHYVVEVDDPVWGKTRQAATPLGLNPPVRVCGPAPRLGEHQDAAWQERREKTTARGDGSVQRKHPFSGLKVADFGAYLAGPMAPSLLSDLGADVIKVEPLTGDRMRFMVPFFDACQRNKRSLAVDFTKPQGQDILARLARWADVAHHNVRMKATLKLGLDEASLRKHNPNIIIGYAGAYGLSGERYDWPGYDTVFQALAGWEYENAGQGNAPMTSRFGSLDVLCALNSFLGTVLAIYHQRRTGATMMACSSLLGVSCLTQSETLIRADGTLAPYPKLDKEQTGFGPFHRLYRAKNGWVVVAALEHGQPEALCGALGVAGAKDLEAAIRAIDCADLLLALERAGVPAEQVPTDALNRFFDDEANLSSKMVVRLPHPDCSFVEQPGAYWVFADTSLRLERSAPLLGEHTVEILIELGYTKDEIARLSEQKIIAYPQAS